MRTQVGIIGAGPAGLTLAQLLANAGVESVVVENRTREYVEARIRAGVLEQGSVDVLTEAGVGDRLAREGIRHDGIYLQWPGERHHLDFPALCGRSVWIYGQTEVTKDLIAARLAGGQELFFDVRDTAVHDVTSDVPVVTFTDADGAARRVECDVVVGADGFHGVSREAIPEGLRGTWEREYPFAWLGVLADVAPSTDELIYAWHPNGFALNSMRSPSVTRLYLQVDPGEDLDAWSDDRIWDELSTRLGGVGDWALATGPITDRSITPMRSFVSTPMRHGRLFLAGDAAHIVPPTGAKGLNLAILDVTLLAKALTAFFQDKRTDLLDSYSDDALAQVWRRTHFSWWMTTMLHTHGDEFDRRLQLSQLRYVTSSEAAACTLAENYTGMPL
jgi:p-hydroxybenzoate 3-monooxygenase